MRIDDASTWRARIPLAIGLACALLAGPGFAADAAGTIKTLKGQVVIERDGQKTPTAVGQTVFVSDRIVTGADSSVGITLRDNTLLSAGAGSTLVLNRFAFNPTTHTGAVDATLKRGSLAVVSGKVAKASPENVVFRSPSASLGVRGTEFIIEAGDSATGEN